MAIIFLFARSSVNASDLKKDIFSAGIAMGSTSVLSAALEWTYTDLSFGCTLGWNGLFFSPGVSLQGKYYFRFADAAIFAGGGVLGTYFDVNHGYGKRLYFTVPFGFEWRLKDGLRLGLECDWMWIYYWKDNFRDAGVKEFYNRDWVLVPGLYVKWDM